MSKNRIDEVVGAIVDAVRAAVKQKDVTFEEYRSAIGFLNKTAEAGELPLMIDLFFNATIVQNINKNALPQTSPSDMEGPYFIEQVPEIAAQGKLKVLDDDTCPPMILRGSVIDKDGTPLSGAKVYVWSSTHDGKYGGIHDGLPADLYRGVLTTDADGRYEVESRVPVPYQIPTSGPTGELLSMMDRHSWRPAHVHYKIRHNGFKELTTQVYFEGGEYVTDDCCEGIIPQEFVKPHIVEDGKVIIEADFAIEQASSREAA